MNTEAVLGAIVPAVTAILKALVEATAEGAAAPSLSDLEAQTHRALPQIGQVVLQALVEGQGAGLAGPRRACDCGGQQTYHDQNRPLTVDTSVGVLRLRARASYQCAACRARSYPVDEQLGLRRAGRMRRSQQEQVGWLLDLLPVQRARAALLRFAWPVVSASRVREQGEALAAPDRAVRITYVAETGPWEAFGHRLWGERQARGLGRPVAALAVVADGSTPYRPGGRPRPATRRR